MTNAASTHSSSTQPAKTVPKKAVVVPQKQPKFHGESPVKPETQTLERQRGKTPPSRDGSGSEVSEYYTADEGDFMAEAEDEMLRSLEAGLVRLQK